MSRTLLRCGSKAIFDAYGASHPTNYYCNSHIEGGTDANSYTANATSVDFNMTMPIPGGDPNTYYWTMHLQYWNGSTWQNNTSSQTSTYQGYVSSSSSSFRRFLLSGRRAGSYRVLVHFYRSSSRSSSSYLGYMRTNAFIVSR